MTEATKFHSSTMLQNYKRLLTYIESYISSMTIDTAERGDDIMKTTIRYYVDHMENRYLNKLFKIVPLDILRETVLGVEYGFFDPTFLNTIASDIHTEIKYYENICECGYIDKTKQVQCWYCDIHDS